MYKVAIAAGGTGGHIFPGISIAEEFIKEISESKILFIGSKNGVENEIIPKYHFEIKYINAKKLYRYFTFQNLLFPFYLIISYMQAKRLLRENDIDIFIGCGGFVSGAVGFAAKKLDIPIFLQEQNSYPGLSTKILAKSSRRIYIGNSEAKNYFKSLISKVIYTGNPIRKFNMVSKKQALHHWNFEEKRTMFVYGGSQGSHSVNQNFVEIIDELLDKEIQILFQTGRKEYGKIIDRFQNREGIVIKPFFDNIEYAYLASDLVICRAGAISLSEIAHFGLPVIIIPFPYSAGQHQLKNALSYNRYGAADILTENELNPKLLLESILKIIKNDTKLKKMSNAIKKLSVSESAKKIVIDIMSSL